MTDIYRKLGALVIAMVVIPAPGLAGATEQAQQRRAGRDVRQDTRQGSRDTKQDCRAADQKSNSQCRQDKRDTKQQGRQTVSYTHLTLPTSYPV